MFKPRFALCVDGGFIQKVLTKRLGHFPSAADVLAECNRIIAHDAVSGCDLLRIYYYDAPPAQTSLTNPLDGSDLVLQNTDRCRDAMKLHADLASAPNVAMRMGDVVVGGWKVSENTVGKLARGPREIGPNDLKPNIRQKGVDIRIGLDIARLSLRDTVRSLVVVTADSDFVPAFKFARREGIRVYLDTLGVRPRPELIEHSDLRLTAIPTPEEVKREKQRRRRQRAKLAKSEEPRTSAVESEEPV
ncbi:NYN domain-containing protein [Phenylobacterium conjunctum]|uniref:NYN domain-containing protein n=1 Tax=Phenylobacterium conjunctum TaxID=1298959 RepID=A0ABW3T2F2_9CAUL